MRELKAADRIYRNNDAHYAFATLPVSKVGGDDFCMTVDYPLVSALTMPNVDATPNLAVDTQSVNGSYGSGKFDFFKGC